MALPIAAFSLDAVSTNANTRPSTIRLSGNHQPLCARRATARRLSALAAWIARAGGMKARSARTTRGQAPVTLSTMLPPSQTIEFTPSLASLTRSRGPGTHLTRGAKLQANQITRERSELQRRCFCQRQRSLGARRCDGRPRPPAALPETHGKDRQARRREQTANLERQPPTIAYTPQPPAGVEERERHQDV